MRGRASRLASYNKSNCTKMREYVRRSYMYERDNAGNNKQRGEVRGKYNMTRRVDSLVRGIGGLVLSICRFIG